MLCSPRTSQKEPPLLTYSWRVLCMLFFPGTICRIPFSGYYLGLFSCCRGKPCDKKLPKGRWISLCLQFEGCSHHGKEGRAVDCDVSSGCICIREADGGQDLRLDSKASRPAPAAPPEKPPPATFQHRPRAQTHRPMEGILHLNHNSSEHCNQDSIFPVNLPHA